MQINSKRMKNHNKFYNKKIKKILHKKKVKVAIQFFQRIMKFIQKSKMRLWIIKKIKFTRINKCIVQDKRTNLEKE